MKIKRYNPDHEHGSMQPDDDGEWVKHEDVELSKCEECPKCVSDLESKIEELERQVKDAYEAGQLMCECSNDWKKADNPPESDGITWSDTVIVITNFGNIYQISYFGSKEGGCWQRPSTFKKDEQVLLWIEKPDLEGL